MSETPIKYNWTRTEVSPRIHELLCALLAERDTLRERVERLDQIGALWDECHEKTGWHPSGPLVALEERATNAEAELAEARAKIEDMTTALDRARLEIRTAAKNWRKSEKDHVGYVSDCGQRASVHNAYRAMAFEHSLEIVEKQFGLAKE